jgi:hypothetical protein
LVNKNHTSLWLGRTFFSSLVRKYKQTSLPPTLIH